MIGPSLELVLEILGGIIGGVLVAVVGYFLINKIKPILRNLIQGLNLPDDFNKSLVNFFVTLMFIFVLGKALTKIPHITQYQLLPFRDVGLIMVSIVNQAFRMLMPISLVFLGYYLYSRA